MGFRQNFEKINLDLMTRFISNLAHEKVFSSLNFKFRLLGIGFIHFKMHYYSEY